MPRVKVTSNPALHAADYVKQANSFNKMLHTVGDILKILSHVAFIMQIKISSVITLASQLLS